MTRTIAGPAAPIVKARSTSLSERMLGFIEGSHARACVVLLLLSLVCFLPGFVSLPPMDRDEPRFAQASKQMIEAGDFVDIRFQGEARHKKPVGIYWLQSAALKAAEAMGVTDARTTIAVYRAPSLVGALATVLLTYWAALAFFGRREAFLAAAFMGASVILMVEARLAKTDAVLTACSVAAMGALARAYFARGAERLPARMVLIFWIAVALGILIKGPLIVMFTGLCGLVLSIRERSPRWLLPLRPGLGVVLVLGLAAPWFVAIAMKMGGAFYTEAIGHDMLGKIATGQQQHWAPPGAYLVAFFATFWPAAILAAIAVPFAWTNRRDDRIAFCLAWIVPSWLVFEAAPTKLPHYVMPLYPAVAIVTVLAIGAAFVGPHRPGAKLAALLIPAIPVAVTVAIVVAATPLGDAIPYAALAVMILAYAIAGFAWLLFVRDDVRGAAITGVAAAAMLSVGVFGLAQPALASLRMSPRLAALARGVDCPGLRVGTLGYREPSLVFLVGTDLAMVENGREAAAFLKAGGCRLMFVERRFEETFRAELAEAGTSASLQTRLSGFNINGGRRVEVAAYVVKP